MHKRCEDDVHFRVRHYHRVLFWLSFSHQTRYSLEPFRQRSFALKCWLHVLYTPGWSAPKRLWVLEIDGWFFSNFVLKYKREMRLISSFISTRRVNEEGRRRFSHPNINQNFPTPSQQISLARCEAWFVFLWFKQLLSSYKDLRAHFP